MLNKEVGSRLYDLRSEKGLTQSEVASALNMGQNQLSRLEKGERTCNIWTLVDFAKYYNVSTDYLLGLTKNSSTDTDVQTVCKATGLSQKAAEVLTGCTAVEDSLVEAIAEDTGVNAEELQTSSERLSKIRNKRRSKVLSALLEYDMGNQFFDRLLDYFDSDYVQFANNVYEAMQAADGDIDAHEYISKDYNFSGSVVVRNKNQNTLCYVGSPSFVDAVLLHTVEREIDNIRREYRKANTPPWLR